jgi:metal-responsive CopG/Arc/MetJ family transcriptional regulator
MATDMVTFNIDDKFLKEVDRTAKQAGYQNRTEFIRAALREKVSEIELKEAMKSLAHLKGASKRKTTDEELERIREEAFDELIRNRGKNPLPGFTFK